MKINGEQIQIREVQIVKLHRTNSAGLELKVCGYPIGIQAEYEQLVPKPQPVEKPTGVMRAGKGAETKPDYNDPAYVAAFDKWMYLQKFYYICKCLLAVNTDLSFANDYTKVDQLEKIPSELNEAGFSEGDVGIILEAIKNATHIDPKAIEEAKASLQ